ncbi:MAG: 4-(cytidine 5'-diphospho)-2-C-methyl-D-erythritol kinase [Rhodobacterales bacterium 32-66-7]|nr:MAG: 4-(cytidine 5'-diphospho)-2-C-methyl-D-erythritol kinase [Rhodobacterales bacterium 12-65-15]OYX27019.1 MAG: 4-(cytidine 5'-diphospho)-2-C-methyl-D-erythritol kinase [Rhodobacterales bacterium 32-66-7]
MPTEAVEQAPAKVNLCLHVTGQRSDGYHMLDSLVVFAGVGDLVTARTARGFSFIIDGPEAVGLVPDGSNLVSRAATAMGVVDVALRLEKRLPVASGIGGGSADAAATLRALGRLTGKPLPSAAEVLALGADVPVCLAGRPARMQGIGEVLSPLPPLPPVWMVLVNPRVTVPTPQVFAALSSRTNAPVPHVPTKGWGDVAALAGWLTNQTRNDLAPAARSIAPVLAKVEAALSATPGCAMARMSGSGATCFGLYPDEPTARAAADSLRTAHPDWWVAEAAMLT